MLPLDDRLPSEILADPRPQPEPPRDTFVYYPDTAEVPESVAVNTRGRSFKILAEVELDEPGRGGRDLRPRLALRRPRALPQGAGSSGTSTTSSASRPSSSSSRSALEPGKHVLGMEFAKESDRRARRGARHDEALRRRRGRRRGADAHAAGAVHALRRRALRRPRLARRREQGVHVAGHASRAGRSCRSRSTSATTSTSTSRSRPPR